MRVVENRMDLSEYPRDLLETALTASRQELARMKAERDAYKERAEQAQGPLGLSRPTAALQAELDKTKAQLELVKKTLNAEICKFPMRGAGDRMGLCIVY